MKIAVNTFRGEAPRITPRELPENAAQEATNCRLQSGDLESWRHFTLVKQVPGSGSLGTIYRLNGQWLAWNQQVDVARGVIEGDTSYRTYLTAPALYGKPQFTNFALATTGAEPYPVTVRPLGVPGPNVAPTLVAGVDSTPSTFSIDVTDSTTELATSWLTSPDVPFTD